MKVVLPADTTFVQINRIPVELCVCRKDLKFNTILNHSDWGTFNEPKYDLRACLHETSHPGMTFLPGCDYPGVWSFF